MNFRLKIPVWLWTLQAVTGLLLVIYIVIHTLDNAMVLIGVAEYEKMLAFWHHTLWSWFYVVMVIGLVGVFLVHAANGIRIASKPYKDIDVSWTHNVKMKHTGTFLWYTQVITGSFIAMFGIWHLIVQHGADPTEFAWQSSMRVTPIVYAMYVLFLAAVMFHSFNGVRAIIIKLGFMTDKSKEAVLISVMALFFAIFFFLGVFSMAKFIPSPDVSSGITVNGTADISGETVNDGGGGMESGVVGESDTASMVSDEMGEMLSGRGSRASENAGSNESGTGEGE